MRKNRQASCKTFFSIIHKVAILRGEIAYLKNILLDSSGEIAIESTTCHDSENSSTPTDCLADLIPSLQKKHDFLKQEVDHIQNKGLREKASNESDTQESASETRENTLMNKIQKLKEQIDKLTRQLRTQQRDKSEIRNTFQNEFTRKTEKLQEEFNMRTEELRRQNAELRRQNAELRKQLQQHHEIVKSTRNAYNGLRKEFCVLQEKFSNLWKIALNRPLSLEKVINVQNQLRALVKSANDAGCQPGTTNFEKTYGKIFRELQSKITKFTGITVPINMVKEWVGD